MALDAKGLEAARAAMTEWLRYRSIYDAGVMSFHGDELANACITAYLSAVSPPDNGGWRPIETAPKDGTRIDLWQHGHWITDAFWDKGEGWWCVDSRYSDGEPCLLAISPDPTHWRPLPAPPATPHNEGSAKQ